MMIDFGSATDGAPPPYLKNYQSHIINHQSIDALPLPRHFRILPASGCK
jgi:hypothetical protein